MRQDDLKLRNELGDASQSTEGEERYGRVRDWGALQGYVGRDPEQAWGEFLRRFSSETATGGEPFHAEDDVEAELQGRLTRIKEEIQPRLNRAAERMETLARAGISRHSVRLKIAIGWMGVTALGWVLGRLLELPLRSPEPTRASDLISLFIGSFRSLTLGLSADFSNLPDWVPLSVGLALIFLAIFAYLNGQRLSGRFESIENMLDALTGTSADVERWNSRGKAGSRVISDIPQRNRAVTWLIAAVLMGALGIGLTIGSTESDYNLSVVLLGYFLAVVTVLCALFVVDRRHLHESETSSHTVEAPISDRTVSRWLTAVVVALVASLLPAWPESMRPLAETICLLAVAALLTLGVFALAAAMIHHNLFHDWEYLLRLNLQLESRLVARRLEAAESRRLLIEKQAGAARRSAEDLEGRRMAFLESYQMGRIAKTLLGNRGIVGGSEYPWPIDPEAESGDSPGLESRRRI